ncbi:hypothetical protein ACHAXT_012495 [Thalassiosira profunda]
MKLKFTHAALGSALSAVAAAAGGVEADANVALADRVAASFREEKTGSVGIQRRVKQMHAGAEDDANAGAGTDVGVLGASSGLFGRFDGAAEASHHDPWRPEWSKSQRLAGLRPSRRLDEEIADAACPRPDTCEPTLCECVGNGGKGFECASELHAVCQGIPSPDAPGGTWTIGGCVAYPEYYQNTYCPFAACVHNGGTYETCDCAFYENWCKLYGTDPSYGDVEKQALYCSVAMCCAEKTDDAGRLTCLAKAPSEMPSMAPSGPTPAPTTGSPTITPQPTEKPPPGSVPGTPPGAPNNAPGAPGAPSEEGCRKNFVGECEDGTSGARGFAAGNAVTAACVAASVAWSLLG